MKHRLGLEPAFPCEVGYQDGQMMQSHQNRDFTALDNGISKRLYIAAMAMQGYLANPDPEMVRMTEDQIALFSFNIADRMLKQEYE